MDNNLLRKHAEKIVIACKPDGTYTEAGRKYRVELKKIDTCPNSIIECINKLETIFINFSDTITVMFCIEYFYFGDIIDESDMYLLYTYIHRSGGLCSVINEYTTNPMKNITLKIYNPRFYDKDVILEPMI